MACDEARSYKIQPKYHSLSYISRGLDRFFLQILYNLLQIPHIPSENRKNFRIDFLLCFELNDLTGKLLFRLHDSGNSLF